MDDKELDGLLRRTLGPEPAPPALRRHLASIPAAGQRRFGLVGRWFGPGLAMGGVATMAAAALLGFWIGTTSLAPSFEVDDDELVTLAFGPSLEEVDLP